MPTKEEILQKIRRSKCLLVGLAGSDRMIEVTGQAKAKILEMAETSETAGIVVGSDRKLYIKLASHGR